MDNNILALQQALNFLGKGKPNHILLVEDGIWGGKTAKAVQDFQINAGLPQTGNLDLVTAEKIKYFIAMKQKSMRYNEIANNGGTITPRAGAVRKENSLTIPNVIIKGFFSTYTPWLILAGVTGYYFYNKRKNPAV